MRIADQRCAKVRRDRDSPHVQGAGLKTRRRSNAELLNRAIADHHWQTACVRRGVRVERLRGFADKNAGRDNRLERVERRERVGKVESERANVARLDREFTGEPSVPAIGQRSKSGSLNAGT